MTITELVEQSHGLAKEKGWWPEYNPDHTGAVNIPEKLALIHSEISEALEAYRKGQMTTFIDGTKPDGFPVELADAVIRIADLCGFLRIDLAAVLKAKHDYNKSRPWRHGGKRA